VLGKDSARKFVGRAHHHPWRLAGFHPGGCSWLWRMALPNVRLTSGALRQSTSVPLLLL
jgi:hypothetical protein